MEELNIIFSRNLKELLAKKELTQADLCKALDVSRGNVSEWCSGKKIPRADKLASIAAYLNCKMSDLLVDQKPEFEVDLTIEGKQTLFLMEKMAPAQQKALFEYAKLLSQMK